MKISPICSGWFLKGRHKDLDYMIAVVIGRPKYYISYNSFDKATLNLNGNCC